MSQDNKAQFYEPNTKIISNPNDAHEIGSMMNAAADREAQLKVQRETGLNEVQTTNVGILDRLKVEYSSAFKTHVEPQTGEEVTWLDTTHVTDYELKEHNIIGDNGAYNFAFTKDGYVTWTGVDSNIQRRMSEAAPYIISSITEKQDYGTGGIGKSIFSRNRDKQNG